MQKNRILFLSVSLMLIWMQSAFASSYTASLQEVPMTKFDYTKQNDAFWKKHLSGETLKVCRMHDTEKPGSGKYDHFYEKGTYNCACCGGDHGVYESKAKFDSGTGWPSFYEPIKGGIIERQDPADKIRGLVGLARTEVICSRCHSHLGHVFDDGPKPTGKRYCMNSAALLFVPEGEEAKNTFDLETYKEQ